jgi:hypothetical protein
VTRKNGSRPSAAPRTRPLGNAQVPAAQPPVTAAVCGLYCEACSVFIATHEDPARLAALAGRWGQTVEDSYCDGCRAERRTTYCRSCDLFACAARRGYAFCGECDDYACSKLDEFRRDKPHRAEIFDNLKRIGEIGADAWLAEVRGRYACPSCDTLNSAYDLKCRACGHEPSNDYVAAHREAIVERLSQL